MKTKLSKKRAISTVLTTVIILVSSVVLGSGVVLYGTSLFQGGTQTENINVSGIKVWVHDTDTVGVAWGAAAVRNTGDKVVAVDKISIRGTDIPFENWYADTSLTSSEFQQALNHTGWVNAAPGTDGPAIAKLGTCASNTSYLCIDQDSAGSGTSIISADAATGPVSLNPGGTAVIYFKVGNGTLTTLDSGASTTVSVFAGKAGGPQSITVAGQS
ncbi:hypothetical protein [Nitrosopumilus sp.]|uniref:hypothetical protein n=1 Tax=Nitrosopumilus sp. TaxID=2024843 RepID=UPI00247E8C16|nr:hypothetical protein [Nitrosopumilus sp.]MCV0430096.1 hypothetical protein [Nitrosopumilus sp.]